MAIPEDTRETDWLAVGRRIVAPELVNDATAEAIRHARDTGLSAHIAEFRSGERS